MADNGRAEDGRFVNDDDEEFELPSRDDRDDGDDDLDTLDLDDDEDYDDDLDSDDDDDSDDDEDDDDSDDDDEDEDDEDEEDEDEEDEDDDYDDLEDALAEDIDLVVGVYREDGSPVAVPLPLDLANDLDELIRDLRRRPADAGAIGMVSLVEEIFVLVRVRGSNVQVLLSDASAAGEWPIARDVADFLGVEEIPDPDDDTEPMGDLGILADLGISEFEMQTLCDDFDSSSDELLNRIADRLAVGPAYRRAVESFD